MKAPSTMDRGPCSPRKLRLIWIVDKEKRRHVLVLLKVSGGLRGGKQGKCGKVESEALEADAGGRGASRVTSLRVNYDYTMGRPQHTLSSLGLCNNYPRMSESG